MSQIEFCRKFDFVKIRECDCCGTRLCSTYINTHKRRYCRGPAAPNKDGEDFFHIVVADHEAADEVEEEEEDVEDEILAEVNEWDQTSLGAGIGGANEHEEEDALQLQRRLAHQREQRERTPPRSESEDSSGWGDLNERWRALRGSPPPPQRRRHDSPPPTSPGALAAPLVLDEDGRPVIPEPPQSLQLPPQSRAGRRHGLADRADEGGAALAHRDGLAVDESGNMVDMDSIQFEVSNEVHHDRGLAIDVFDLSTPTQGLVRQIEQQQRGEIEDYTFDIHLSSSVRIQSEDTPTGAHILDISEERLRGIVTRLRGRGQTPANFSTPSDQAGPPPPPNPGALSAVIKSKMT